MTPRESPSAIDPDAAPSAQLAAALGVVVVPELLERALTHRSYSFEHGGVPHSERLEFLGDAILGEAVTVHLFTAHPDLDEGQLAKRRSALVSTVALAKVARGIGLGPYLHLGRGEHLTGGADKDSILADAVEAIIGAVYLSAGHESAAAFVLRLVEPLQGSTDRVEAEMDPKTALQELAQRLGGLAPEYRVTATGPDHERAYHAVVTVGREASRGGASQPLATASGTGTSKKTAEMAAALRAWTRLSEQEPR